METAVLEMEAPQTVVTPAPILSAGAVSTEQAEAWERFTALPMPKRTDEEWRFANLKLVDLDAKSLAERGDLLGRDTRSAMLHGVLHETSLAIEGLRRQLQEAWPGTQWDLICTGGDGEILSILLDSPFVPGLILQGVRLMVLGGWKQDPEVP